VDTLRAWERRYGIFEPTRSRGGFRLYSQGDERRAHAMQALIGEGLSAAQAADAVREGRGLDGASGGHAALAPELLARELVQAVGRLSEEDANRVLDRAFGALSLEAVMREVLLPALRAIGEGWARGEVSVGQEHFATNLLRGRLLGIARGWMSGSGPVAVLACPPGESHDLGLIVFGLALRARGWRIAFLGADTPVESIAESADALDAALIVVTALAPEALVSVREDLAELGAHRQLALAGAGSAAEGLEAVPALRLEEGPVESAERVSREMAATQA
jgi:MerR family transcriptional regulator, light-induced transcriptional regulator